MGSEIIVCGRRFDIGHPVRTFADSDGYSAYVEHRTDDPTQKYPQYPAPGMEGRALRYRERRLLGRDRTLASLKRAVRQVVVHLDGTANARLCFNVLHNEHGLSVHFMVDNDGVIYQTLDLVDCAFHAAGVNEVSVGIELQNRGDAARFPHSYKTLRPTVTCTVHGTRFLAYDFTDAQYVGMVHLSRALGQILDVPFQIPRSSAGEQIWTTIPEPRSFPGFIGHYHVTNQKWDPGPWDFSRMFRSIGSKVTFPLSAITEKPISMPELAESYFEASEEQTAGRFPVGPMGESRLWHGGVHLPGVAGGPIYAVIPGRIVLAKMAGPCPTGSCNFILIRHLLDTGARSVPFYSLYYHLRRDETAPPWRDRNPRAAAVLGEGRTALLDVPVDAGELLGHVGEAGPAQIRRPEMHFAIFSVEELGAIAEPGYWDVVLGTETNRFCRNKEIIDRIDRPDGGQPRDGLLSRRELSSFFRENPLRADFRRMAVRHLSEWTAGDWQAELETAPDFKELPESERRRLVAEQIEPTLWWTKSAGEHAGLPEDGVVYSYHPIGFLVWYAELMKKKAKLRAAGIELARADLRVSGTENFKLDTESTTNMTDQEDLMAGEEGQKLRLEELIDGYPE